MKKGKIIIILFRHKLYILRRNFLREQFCNHINSSIKRAISLSLCVHIQHTERKKNYWMTESSVNNCLFIYFVEFDLSEFLRVIYRDELHYCMHECTSYCSYFLSFSSFFFLLSCWWMNLLGQKMSKLGFRIVDTLWFSLLCALKDFECVFT